MHQSSRTVLNVIAARNAHIEFEVIDYPDLERECVARYDTRTGEGTTIETFSYTTTSSKRRATALAKALAYRCANQEPEEN